LIAPGVVYLKTKSETTTFNGVAGVNRFEAPLEIGSGVEVLVVSWERYFAHIVKLNRAFFVGP
jgi:hypothetical protein